MDDTPKGGGRAPIHSLELGDMTDDYSTMLHQNPHDVRIDQFYRGKPTARHATLTGREVRKFAQLLLLVVEETEHVRNVVQQTVGGCVFYESSGRLRQGAPGPKQLGVVVGWYLGLGWRVPATGAFSPAMCRRVWVRPPLVSDVVLDLSLPDLVILREWLLAAAELIGTNKGSNLPAVRLA